MLEVQNINKSFKEQNVLSNLNFSLQKGDQVAIKGSSGCGKSTLLHLIAGLDKADSGKILFEGENISSFDDERLAVFRRDQIGIVFQFHFLLPSLTALENIELPMKMSGKKIDSSRLDKLVTRLGLSNLLNKNPFQLSGGEQQRVSLARALSGSPKLLLCDEPTGNLDQENTINTTELIFELSKENSISLIFVTHDPVAANYFSKQYQLVEGHLQNCKID